MDDILEFVIDLLLDIGTEVAGSKKTPKWLRCPLIALFILLYTALTLGLLIGGVLVWSESPLFSVLLILAGLVIGFLGIRKLLKERRQRESKKIEPFL